MIQALKRLCLLYLQDLANDELCYEDYIVEAIKVGCSSETLECLLTASTDYNREDLVSLQGCIYMQNVSQRWKI